MGVKDEDIFKEWTIKKVIGFDTTKPRKTYNQVMTKCFKNVSDSRVLNNIYKQMQEKVMAQDELFKFVPPTRAEEIIQKIDEKFFN